MSPDTPPPPPPFSNTPAFNPAAPRPVAPPRNSGAAVASLILGIASLACLCFTALPGLICGFIGLANIGKSNGQLKGRGLAILGIILSLVLPIAGLAAWVAVGGKQLSENPMFKELLGAGKTAFQAATRGTEIAAALKAHADANDGRLPASLEELVVGGALDASKLTNPADGSPGFWTLTEPGAVLADLPAKTVIARGGPITAQGESLEVAVYADGTVTPREITAAAGPEAHGGEGPSELPGATAPAEAGTAVPEPAVPPAAPDR